MALWLAVGMTVALAGGVLIGYAWGYRNADRRWR